MKRHSLSALIAITLAAAFTFAAPPRPGGFPGYGLVPKEETGAARFLNEHPEYDGRGVVVAIFDTGVDPGAPGLQVTSDGRPKIVDIVDGSGSGDVDTSVVVEAKDGVLAGLTGRSLKIGAGWNNPPGHYHVGLKRAYELYPAELVGRLVRKQREKWDEQQRVLVTGLERELADWQAAHPTPSKEQEKEQEEIEARLAQLKKMQDGYDDPGPVFDCVVFHDGNVWRAAIDTNEDGDLADEKLMTNYRLERQYATFGYEDQMHFAVNVYDEGNLLSIVADVGSHGTHVAGIVAANFPDESDLNGLAPGAQLVAVKIGDPRLGSNSCATGEVRGCIAVLQNKCDLINQSFGEPSADPDVGRNSEIYSEIVNEYGVMFVSSAGNEGPALSTVGYPGGSTGALWSIGAYVSPDMMEAQYSLRERLPATLYNWTSRGPTYDGAPGVNFCAPGGAIAPVPNWVLQRNTQMHGTSMASPNACGNIALLLSGLKADGIAYSPPIIRRAIENTAAPVAGVDVFGQGRGLVQIDRAYEYMKKYAGHADDDLRFEVRVPARGNARGIYLREPYETDHPLETNVSVTPVFRKDADNRDKIDFELRVTLESTAKWVECADHMMLMSGGRRLSIKVDPTRLPPGVHYAEICGYDSTSPERGPLFRLPITVVRPQPLEDMAAQGRGHATVEDYAWQETLSFQPEHIERRFLAVPPGATWADVHVRRLDEGEPRTIALHALQLVPGYRFDGYELKDYLRLDGKAEESRSLQVVGGRTLEVCLVQPWSSLGECELDVRVTFHGIVPDRDEIGLEGGEIATRISVETPLRPEHISPKASLDTLRQLVRPSKSEIRPLDGERDRLPEDRQIYELVLTYDFKMPADGSVTPRVAMTNILEYQESWQSSLYMIFDSAKRVVTRWGLVPRQATLSKGDYVLRFHLRHDDLEQLKKLEDMVLMLDHKLASSVGLHFYSDPDNAIGGGKFAARTLPKGGRAVLWVADPAVDKLPKDARPGDVLLGTMNFGGSDDGPGEGSRRPGGYQVTYVVPPKPPEKKEAAEADEQDKDERGAEQKLAEALRDFKVGRLAKLHGEKDRALFDRLADEILAEYPNHLPVLVEQLKRADGKKRGDDLEAVVAAADRVIAQIDQEKLAAHYGVKLDPDDKAGAKIRKEMDLEKAALLEALHRKAKALFELAAKTAAADASASEPFEQAFAELEKWADTTTGDYLMLHIDRQVRRGQPGEALKLLNEKIAGSKPDKELYEKRIAILDALGWSQWKQYEETWLLLRFPQKYPPF